MNGDKSIRKIFNPIVPSFKLIDLEFLFTIHHNLHIRRKPGARGGGGVSIPDSIPCGRRPTGKPARLPRMVASKILLLRFRARGWKTMWRPRVASWRRPYARVAPHCILSTNGNIIRPMRGCACVLHPSLLYSTS